MKNDRPQYLSYGQYRVGKLTAVVSIKQFDGIPTEEAAKVTANDFTLKTSGTSRITCAPRNAAKKDLESQLCEHPVTKHFQTVPQMITFGEHIRVRNTMKKQILGPYAAHADTGSSSGSSYSPMK